MNWLRKVRESISPDELDWENAEVHEPVRDSNIATYNLQIFSPRPEQEAPSYDAAEKRVLADLPAMLELVEEEFSKRLPTGFRVQISKWNEPH